MGSESRRGNRALGAYAVRAAGTRAGKAEFQCPLPLLNPASKPWERVTDANRKMAAPLPGANGGGVGQVYDERSKMFDPVVKEYLLAWAALLEESAQRA